MTEIAGTGDEPKGRLELATLLNGRQLMIVGGTGFLGKVLCSLLLVRYPGLERLVLIVRRNQGGSGSERFWQETMHNYAFLPLREQHGARFEAFLRDKVLPIEGDIVLPQCGVSSPQREQLQGKIAALVNASGVVDFEPPLDVGLQVNAFGVQNLVSLARSLGNCPLLHTSTCFVAGRRTGFVEEEDPRVHPFPRMGELDRAHWDPDREITECLSIIEQAKQRANDAFRQSHFHREARKNLIAGHEPATGATLDREVERVKRAYIEAQLAQMGNERARFWGWPNTYTYTKSIGEQIAMSSGLQVTIVRPAIVETSVQFPMPGWNEGINTSAPLIYAIREGQTQLPGSTHNLDVIPCDMVAGGMVMALGELLEGTAKPVYQLGASDSNPVTMARIFELTGLYKRKHQLQRHSALGTLQAHVEGALFSSETFEKVGPKAVARVARSLGNGLKAVGREGALKSLLQPATFKLEEFARAQQRIGKLLTSFAPFTADYDYTFRCGHVRAARARLSPEDRKHLYWEPETIDWRQWFLQVHAPALERWVFPEIERRRRRPPRPKQAHETLPGMLDELSARHDWAIALQHIEPDGLARFSYRDLRSMALACSERLTKQGVKPGDRVVLIARNHPAWAMAFFGILYAGATVVPVDANVDAQALSSMIGTLGVTLCVADTAALERLGKAPSGVAQWLDLRHITQQGPLPAWAIEGASVEPRRCSSSDIAVIAFTSGTTSAPKAVMLSHANITSLLAALAPIFPLDQDDRALSVVPLHQLLELSCGLLLPLSRGARVIYFDPQRSDLTHALKAARATTLIGTPGVWEGLQRSLYQRASERGMVSERLFKVAAVISRRLGRDAGIDVGRVMFAPLHNELGGELRTLICGGGALPQATREALLGLGLPVRESYGLAEAAPVLAFSAPGAAPRAAHVGKAIPGVEIQIADPNVEGVGEVLARGPSVMQGYANDERGTQQVVDAQGWLHTGDLGRIDQAGNLMVLGRLREVIVRANGEHIYPDEVEAQLGSVPCIDELCVVGVSDGQGGERAVCVAVPAAEPKQAQYQRQIRAKAALLAALAKLPLAQRPSEHVLLDGPLPRSAAHRVKRTAVRELVEQHFRRDAGSGAHPPGGAAR